MLTIILPANDDLPEIAVNLEHSLLSLSAWEAETEKPFYGKEQMTEDETRLYIRKMLLQEAPPGNWLSRLTSVHYEAITEYLNSKQSATWFREDRHSPPSREIVTNELIYYWMTNFNIPFDPCERWHINRLMILVKICGLKQTKPKKMSRQQQADEYRRLNAERRQQLGTTG